MGQRLDLQALLETIVDHVYFQPPSNIQLVYPCIIYKRDFADTKFADDIPYANTTRYMVTVIDREADSVIPPKVAALPMTLFNRYYSADELHHDVYNVFF
jgi:hypothetical protein